MRTYNFKAILKAALRVACLLPFAAVAAFGQQQINLTAGPSSVTLPDGSSVPMWGYSCGTVVGGSLATCAKLNPLAGAGWSPVVITVPTGQSLTINLTNNLPVPPGATSGIPTSLTIVGQLGGGLGTTATSTPSPIHPPQGPTWPIAGDNSGPTFNPPGQGNRVQSFSSEVPAGTTTLLPAWTNLRPGTYLIESGTHPSIQGPMGLYGMLVVTSAPATALSPFTAYPGVNYNADVRLLLSEIDPVQNNAVNKAVNTAGFIETATHNLKLGDSVNSIAVTYGGVGYKSIDVLTVNITGGGTPITVATATASIDTDNTSPTYGQVISITVTNPGAGYSSNPIVTISGGTPTKNATAVSGLLLANSDPCAGGVPACYPPAVNYAPLYYLFNGVAFDKTNASASLFPTFPASIPLTPGAKSVLVRLVNAGLRMHVPSIIGSQTTGQTGATTPTVTGFQLIAEDGNPLPGVRRVQSEVFMAAGKTYDVMMNVPAAGGSALPVYDRELSLSGNATARDAGMLAYIAINGSGLPSSPALAGAVANPDTYNSVIAGQTLTVSDPARGVIANDVNIYGVQVVAGSVAGGTLALNTNGTFTFAATAASGSFQYCGNGATSGLACTTVTLGAAPIEAASGISVGNKTYTSNLATALSIKSPGVLSTLWDACTPTVANPCHDRDGLGYPLTVAVATVTPVTGLTVSMDKSGAFNASVAAPGTYTFTYQAQNSQGTMSASSATVTLIFPTGSGLSVKVLDGADKKTVIGDYRWIIEEDRTFYINPACTTNPPPAGCPTVGSGIVPTFGTNFHTSYMPLVAAGCTGALSCESGQTVLGAPAVCDVGNGVCRTTATQETAVDPSQVVLDPTKRYYISVLPGDAANPFAAAYGGAPDCSAAGSAAGMCGHGMGGAPISFNINNGLQVQVLTQPTPFPPAKLSVFVFEDDSPLNGEQDAGGGVDVLAPNEPGLGGFQITLFDDAGGPGDATGQPTYDMFNQPLSNSLSGQIDPVTGNDACPISANARTGFDGTVGQLGITSMIVTCPKYESDGVTLSPLAGQAVIANLYPGRYGVVATPGADRIARGEEWLQTNTLDGQKAHDSFLRIGEPSFFQEFGPAGFHVSIGFANPAIINGRLPEVCAATTCNNTVTGLVTTERMSRTPDERLYSSGDNSSFAFTQCYVSMGDPDGADFAFTKCNSDGTFTLSGLPPGSWRVTVFDQWNDMLVDGLSTPVALDAGKTVDMGQIAMNQWQANIYTSTFFDQNGDGVRQGTEPGLTLVPTNIRFRDGSFSNFNNTDLNGNAGFNEVFPLFSWYVVETDTTRYKSTGTHVVYDAGGPADGTTCGGGFPPCGTSAIGTNLANTAEQVPVPANLRVPGAFYCANADCTDALAPLASGGTGGSTGRIDPPWVQTEGWQGFSGQNSFLEFGKKPFAAGENGGIHGHVVYASTRPFDDPQLLVQLQWEPQVPNVTMNLYQEGTALDGSTSLKLVDTTQTSSWDAWAQGFRSDGIPNMNCPGQSTSDLFYFSLFNQPNTLNPGTSLPNNSQFKCYDGMHNWNQLQPAPYDGAYQFPSVTSINPATGKPAGTNCHISTAAEPWGCVPNPDTSDPYRVGTPMLPKGKYVVEVVVPPGYVLEKEEDKNILIGDNYIAPVTQQFAGLGNIFIIPDQAAVGAAYNPNNPQNPTTNLGTAAVGGIDAAPTQEQAWPCVGASRIVPDFISLFPQSQEVSPFAGATRNLCDRKEVTVVDQASALARFYIFTSTHVAAHFTGVITDDFTSEFDPFSPQFGEKFSPANLPIAIKDWTGTEIARVYSDHWGAYNGLTYSTWEVNPPNPTGYAPTMMVTCMNDPGTGTVPDPLFNPAYSQFCYEIPFMPGATQYMDTPVVPTSAFAGAGYNNPDCAYPDATPAVKSVIGSDGVAGPWVSAGGSTHTLTITALGNQTVNNYGYSGPSATVTPFNQKTVTRHYGFGSCPISGGFCTNGASAALTQIRADGSITTIPLNINSWTDMAISASVPNSLNTNPQMLCAIQQQAQYGGPNGTTVTAEHCGELVITAANGKKSVDGITVTVGGKHPAMLNPQQTIQSAIDAATPGDLIIVPPGTYSELLLMWKPVRLQGVGAASSIINANTHPAGKLDVWRAAVNCLFGLALNGQPFPTTEGGKPNPYDSTGALSCPGSGWKYFTGVFNNPQVDRLPLEGLIGWDTTVNGNLAELLQEPSLMGAYEGAGITVLAKGVNTHGAAGYYGSGTEAAFPAGTTPLLSSDCGMGTSGSTGYIPNPFPSNFQCNPSRIDGLAITDSSQGGGGIFVHAWGHNLEIANNRIYNNTGTLGGGINMGQGEFPDAYLQGDAGNASPGSCVIDNGLPANLQLPYCFQTRVNVHHNSVTLNSSIGDELFSGTPAGAGGVNFCTGSDYYRFNYNWICGNLSSGDGGGVGHLGFSWNGDIEHNSILFNQSTNPTIPTNGGGLVIMGAAPDGQQLANGTIIECGSTTDVDCAPGLSDGTGPGLVINANLIQGNGAEAGSGGGLRLQNVNGTEIANFPGTPTRWNSVSVTNNIIANNVAGWDGGGVSLQDALNVNIISNTIISNDSTASSGVLTNTLGAPLASVPPPGTNLTTSSTASAPQVAGLVTVRNTPNLIASFAGLTISCPTGHANCTSISNPLLENDLFWQNRSFHITVGGYQNAFQQNVVSLVPTLNQAGTGACPTGASYWDIGVRGDTGPTNHSGLAGFSLAPTWSVLTSTSSIGGSNNSAANPLAVSEYCNGSRVPPENGGLGYQVPPGIADATVPNPIFNLTPAATVDEGNNWININWGPLAQANPVSGTQLGNYALSAGSPAIDHITCTSTTGGCLASGESVRAPITDFFGNPRPDTGSVIDVGAVELQGAHTTAGAFVSPTSLSFGSVVVNTTSVAQTLTLTNVDTSSVTGISIAFTGPFSRAAGGCTAAQLASLAAGTSCAINVVFTPTLAQFYTGSVTITASNTAITGSPVALDGTGIAASVTPASLSFGNVTVNTNSTTQNLTLQTSVTLTNVTLSFSSAVYSRTTPTGGGPAACGAGSFTLAAGTSCRIGVVFHPTALGTVNGTLSIAATGATITNSPVALSGTGYQASVSPTSLTFANQTVNTNSATQNVTLSAGVALNTITFTFSSPVFSRVAPTSGTACTATLAAGSTCNIGVRFTPTAIGLVNATLTVAAQAGITITGSPVSLTGTGALGALTTLDNFNRSVSTNLGPNWAQQVTSGVAAIDIFHSGSGNSSGVAFCDNTAATPACGTSGGSAYWNPTVFSSRQSASFVFSSVTVDSSSLILKATGGTASAPLNFIRVQYSGGMVSVSTTTNGGASFTTAGAIVVFGAGFQLGDTMTATVDQTGLVTVWQNSTLLGSEQLPSVALWTTGGGRIGMQLFAATEVDNFAGGNF